MSGFQRARSAEQREVRRRSILDAAAAMLAEMPVAEVSLNELSRRAGLAKSNVLRYFDSREAVLLELLTAAMAEWLAELAEQLPAAVDPTAGAAQRGEQVAAVLAATAARRPVLCDLISAQAAVLERNVSASCAAEFKRAAVRGVDELARLVRAHVGELDLHAARAFGGLAPMTIGAIWTHTHPSASMQAAYRAHPELAALRLDFAVALRETLAILLAGLLARPGPAWVEAAPGWSAVVG